MLMVLVTKGEMIVSTIMPSQDVIKNHSNKIRGAELGGELGGGASPIFGGFVDSV